MPAPVIPHLQDDLDTRNFDEEFTKMDLSTSIVELEVRSPLSHQTRSTVTDSRLELVFILPWVWFFSGHGVDAERHLYRLLLHRLLRQPARRGARLPQYVIPRPGFGPRF